MAFINRVLWNLVWVGLDVVACIATCYWLDGPRIESKWGRDFPHRSRPALGPTKPPAQWVSFPELKRPGRGLDHPSPSSAKVKERAKLYLYSSSGLSWPVLQWTLPHYNYISLVVHNPHVYVRKCTVNIKVNSCHVRACEEERRNYSSNRFAPSALEGDA
jgi:hypothetical protein